MSMLIGDRELDLIRAYEPQKRHEESLMRASVAIILRDTAQGSECLMMQRAKHESDPWSGQMSFPGGKIEQSDIDAKAAAVRETREEVGAELGEQDYIGQIDELYGLRVNGVFSVHVSCFVFKPKSELSLVANHEVADMVWLPLSYLNEPRYAHDYVHPSQKSLSMPAVMINAGKDQILWGLSLRMLMNLYELLGLSIPILSQAQQKVLRDIEDRELPASKLDNITRKIVNQRSE